MSIHNGSAYYNSSDVVKCPSFCNAAIQVLGTITVNGLNHNNYLCGGCNKTFTALPPHVKALATSASIDLNSISFTSNSLSTQNSANFQGGQNWTTISPAWSGQTSGNWQNGTNVSATNPGWELSLNKPVDINYNSQLSSIETNIKETTSAVRTLQYNIQNLLDEISKITQQNNKLMEQLAKDPLSGIRKSILDFNLK